MNIGELLTTLVLSANFIAQPLLGPTDTCSGDVYQIVDSEQKPVMAQKFALLTPIGHGLMRARSVNAENPFLLGDKSYILTPDGADVTPALPKGATLTKIAWFGIAAEKDGVRVLKQLPEDALIQFRLDGRLGLCDVKGKIVLPPDYFSFGETRNGAAFLNTHNGEVLSYDFAKKQLRSIPKMNTNEDLYYLRFDDGLAPFRDSRVDRVGYVSTDGNVVIEPTFVMGRPFKNGNAIATIALSDNLDRMQNVLIDTRGKVVSPGDLDIEEVFVDCIVVRKRDAERASYGLVDRSFRQLIEPKYRMLSGRTDPDNSNASPLYFVAMNFIEADPASAVERYALSREGSVLFKLPDEAETINPISRKLTRCRVPSSNPDSFKFIDLDMNGNVVATVESVNSPPAAASLTRTSEIAPDRFIKQTLRDTGKFDPEFWKLGQYELRSRQEMFDRFLEEYNLKGMQRADVLRLLGNGETQSGEPNVDASLYLLRAAECGSGRNVYVKVLFSNDVVVDWGYSNLNRENVLTHDITEAISRSQALPPVTQPSVEPDNIPRSR